MSDTKTTGDLGAYENLRRAMAAVIAERARQDLKHGGPTADDEHTPDDWWNLIVAQREKWEQAIDLPVATYTGADLLAGRECFVRIAALAVAAVQSIDRAYEGQD